MVHAVTLPNGYEISDDRRRLDMESVHDALAGAYWAVGRERALTERSWANCLCFGVYAPDGTQAGFARLLTDYTFHAHLGDVFIAASSRGLGLGLGKALIETILGHPELATVVHWTLVTADAQGLYARYGFRLGEVTSGWMALDRTARDAGPWRRIKRLQRVEAAVASPSRARGFGNGEGLQAHASMNAGQDR